MAVPWAVREEANFRAGVVFMKALPWCEEQSLLKKEGEKKP